jgi:hypothetical protein
MPRLDEVSVTLVCGAEVTLRVIVDTANCRLRDGLCMTAEDVAGAIWLALQEAELTAGAPAAEP